MRIQDISVDGFGHFANFQIAQLPTGLTILYGPNEAGKTTLVSFIEYVLYGIPPYSREKKPTALAGGRLGGRLTLVDDSGDLFTIERHGRNLAVQKNQRIVASNDDQLGQIIKISRNLYRAVFAFELSDLASLESLNPGGNQSLLLASALVGAGNSAAAAQSLLDKQNKTLRNSTIKELESTLNDLKYKLHQAGREAGEFLNFQNQIQALEASRQQHNQDHVRHSSEAQRWQTYIEAYPHFLELKLAREHLETLPPARSINPDLGARLTDLHQTRSIQQVRLDTAQTNFDQASTSRDQIKPNTLKLQYTREIQQLSEDVTQVGRESLQNAIHQRDTLTQRLTEALRRTGVSRDTLPQWTTSEVAALKRAASEAVDAAKARDIVKTHEDITARAAELVLAHTARRDAIDRDLVAEGLMTRVEDLDRDAPKRFQALEREHAISTEIQALEQELAAPDLPPDWSSGARPNPRPEDIDALTRAINDWRGQHSRARAALDFAEEQGRVARENLVKSNAQKTKIVSDPKATLDPKHFSEIESNIERACNAHARA